MKRINALAALILLAGSPFAVGVQWELPGAVGAQWKLPGAVGRRNQSLALGLFLNPRPIDGHSVRTAI